MARSGDDRLLEVFRRAAIASPAYRTLLDEAGVTVDAVTSVEAFCRLCPILNKENVFGRFPIDQLGPIGATSDIADVLTSSGRGGRFSFGLSTRAQAASSGRFLDEAFDAAYEVRSRSTLAINCLPMGVGFESDVMTIANTGVRPDRVVAVVETFGLHYDQVLLVTDPLFLKCLTDFATDAGFDWHRYRINVCIAEEIFGEHFRTHVTACLGTDVWQPGRGRFMSSFGVGELGLYLGYETLTTIALRRAAHNDPAVAAELFGLPPGTGEPLPMLFAFNPQRTFIESVERDAAGYGRMTISMLDPERMVPLLRYQAGDIAALLDPDRLEQVARRNGIALPGPVPRDLFALRGRQAEALPNGSHVGVYKDALYANPRVAASVTGVARVIMAAEECTVHVQLRPSIQPALDLEQQLFDCLPAVARPTRIVFWPFAQFPFGMTLDYVRPFPSYVPGESPANFSA